MTIAARPSCLLGLATLLTVVRPATAQLIDTGTPPVGANPPIFPFGRATSVSWATLGQSFLVPVGGPTRLDDFTFWLRDNGITGSTPYHAYIFDWNPTTRRTGSSYLFRSAAQDYTGEPGPTAVSFTTGGLDLVGGQSYIAVLSSVEFAGAPVGLRPGAIEANNSGGDYTGGMSYTRPGPSGLATLTTNQWAFLGGTGVDLAFRANFSAAPAAVVPEPGSATLVALGVVGLAVTARRRRPRRDDGRSPRAPRGAATR
jgi:hypothetical protein